ncbi:MAG: amidohydrolase family protein [Gemmatimonadales bacterium]
MALSISATMSVSGCQHVPSVRPDASRAIAITHVAVADATVYQTRNDMTVVIERGIIRRIGPSVGMSIPVDANVIDGTGKVMIPGLWDMHVHLSYEGGWALGEYIVHGVTSVRDMGTTLQGIDSARASIASGALVGPHIVAAGPMIESPEAMRGILAGRSSPDSAIVCRVYLPLASPAAATRAVDSIARLGANLIKGRDFIDAPTYWAVANAARRNGLAFVGHAPFGLAIDPVALADSGQRSLEHWYFPVDLMGLPKPDYDRIVGAYVRNGTTLDPTLTAWRPHRYTVDSLEKMLAAARVDPRAKQLPGPLWNLWRKALDARRTEESGRPATVAELAGWNRVLDKFARETATLANAGVNVVAGSDLPFATFPGDALHNEMVALVTEGGFTPRQALESATRNAARSLRMDGLVGTVAVGKRADLVLLDADPLQDIRNIRRVRLVLRDGIVVWQK